jgi:hypothetical protein
MGLPQVDGEEKVIRNTKMIKKGDKVTHFWYTLNNWSIHL